VLTDKKLNFTVSPIHATIIWHFQEKGMFSNIYKLIKTYIDWPSSNKNNIETSLFFTNSEMNLVMRYIMTGLKSILAK